MESLLAIYEPNEISLAICPIPFILQFFTVKKFFEYWFSMSCFLYGYMENRKDNVCRW